MDKKENLAQKCQSCGKRNFVTDNENSVRVFCKRCGYVVPEQSNEVNSIPYNVEECKTGSPTSLAKHDMGLSTVIGSANHRCYRKTTVNIHEKSCKKIKTS